MLSFLDSRQEPFVTRYYVADKDGNPVMMKYEEFKTLSNDTDPFLIPNGSNVTTDPRLQNLLNARFLAGFRARMGIPPMDDPAQIPDVVVLDHGIRAVQFNLLASDFTVVELKPGGGYAPATWTRTDQPQNSPWVFTSSVDLNLSVVEDTAYSHLPSDVQDQIKNMGATAFDVKQLLFDLSNAKLMSIPTMTGIQSGMVSKTVLQQYFLGAYFEEMSAEGQPLLGCSIQPKEAATATMTLTDMNLGVSPYVDDMGQPVKLGRKDLATLNYLCAADEASLPPTVAFSWNWVDESEVEDHDGILAINRTTFANYFRYQLREYIPTVCLLPWVHVGLDGLVPNYSWSLTSGQTPTVDMPTSGQTVLIASYSKESYDEAGTDGALGQLRLKSNFNLSVEFRGGKDDSKIVVTQHLVIYLYVKKLATAADGNVFDKKFVHEYYIGVDDLGRLKATATPVVVEDKAVNLEANGFENFFVKLNELAQTIKDDTTQFAEQTFHDIPLNTFTQYVFPGGQTFVFKNASFSDTQDLTADISYADPTKPLTTVPSPVQVFGIKRGTSGIGKPKSR